MTGAKFHPGVISELFLKCVYTILVSTWGELEKYVLFKAVQYIMFYMGRVPKLSTKSYLISMGTVLKHFTVFYK